MSKAYRPLKPSVPNSVPIHIPRCSCCGRVLIDRNMQVMQDICVDCYDEVEEDREQQIKEKRQCLG